MSEHKPKIKNELAKDPLMPMRHTAEHVLHMAAQELYPNLKKVMGPPIEDGFYFDFDLEESINPEGFEEIENRMAEIIAVDLPVRMREIDADEAVELFADNQYKLDNIAEIQSRGEKISICEIGDKGGNHYDIDLCAGPHVDSTGKVGAFKLLRVAGAYYKGDENNKMLQRIYGTAWESQEKLDAYLEKLQRAQENDHRILNKTLDIFAFSDLVGKGLVMFTPNGTIIKNQLKNYLLSISEKHGAKEVDIPHLAKIELYETSGHADKFKEELFRVVGHYDEFILKPVNCPHHTQIYASRPRSYRDLPLAYVESTQQHRDEKPGAMGGLNRTRSFEIDDGHTFCTPEQTKGEVVKLINVMQEFYSVFDMWGKHWVSLSFRDPKNKQNYIGDDADWEIAQNMLREVNHELDLNGKEIEGEAALYGPKIDIMMKDANGNNVQLGTVQVDFAMPKRFGLTYIDAEGQEKTPVMLHRAILGSYGRFIASLMERTGGAFPVWLSPQQISVIPIADKHLDYAYEIKKEFEESGLRIDVDARSETMQNKIRQAQSQKTPYMFILGDKEVSDNTISVRLRDGETKNGLSVKEVLEKVKEINLTKSLQLW